MPLARLSRFQSHPEKKLGPKLVESKVPTALEGKCECGPGYLPKVDLDAFWCQIAQ